MTNIFRIEYANPGQEFIASSNTIVIAKEESFVIADRCSFVFANEGSFILALPGSIVVKEKRVIVQACPGSFVTAKKVDRNAPPFYTANNKESIYPDHSFVAAYPGSEFKTGKHSVVVAVSNSKFTAGDHSTIVALNHCSITVGKNCDLSKIDTTCTIQRIR